jgi:hypothetical protein
MIAAAKENRRQRARDRTFHYRDAADLGSGGVGPCTSMRAARHVVSGRRPGLAAGCWRIRHVSSATSAWPTRSRRSVTTSSVRTTASASFTACRLHGRRGAVGKGTVMRSDTVRRYAEAGFGAPRCCRERLLLLLRPRCSVPTDCGRWDLNRKTRSRARRAPRRGSCSSSDSLGPNLSEPTAEELRARG